MAAAGALLVALGLGGCGTATTPGATGSPVARTPSSSALVPVGYMGRFRISATVLSSPQHGPQLCGAVADSLPPQCGGPDVKGWDWTQVRSTSRAGTTWGDYLLVGTWDGASFTMTQPAAPPPTTNPDARPGVDLSSPCDTPAGGWQPAEPATTTRARVEQVLQQAGQSSDFAGGWVTQLDGLPASASAGTNDPARMVLNLRYTGDLTAHEREARSTYGGALCVTVGARPLSQLQEVQGKLAADFPGGSLQSSGIDVTHGTVQVETWVATTDQQNALDDRYGVGVVELHGLLQPID